ncbi:hypothetical protein HPB52_019786 [Rhipicephalus sanguineus]|uniref:GH18 domain-containing protein n=1 Tax=Rhipicephalus sanguineus TaxID=34632 RepID=A0A9D4PIC8_RHISA|nr:hypothetical protein HPB52_019786 [Rhipicephalus sanguineus]
MTPALESPCVVPPSGRVTPAVALPGIKKPTTDKTTTPTSPASMWRHAYVTSPTAQMRVTPQLGETPDTRPPYGGFAGVPAYVEDPNVIVFVPRAQSTRGRLVQTSTVTSASRTPPQGAPGSGPSVSPPFYSQTIPSSPVEDERTESLPAHVGIPITRVYLLCCTVVATLIVPFGTILVSYTTTHGGSRPVVRSPRTFNYHLTLPLTQPTMSTTPPPSAACLDRVHIDDVQSAINATAQAHVTHVPRRMNLFCIYNNSRVLKGAGRHFIPADLPLNYCTNIIYWSLAIKNGSVKSRTPLFDRTQGLSKLRQLTDAAGHPDSKILAAIGGYPEDSPEFSLLGHDPLAIARFTTSTASIVKTHRLHGIAIHWVTPHARCHDPGDEATLIEMVKLQRTVNNINGYPVVIAVFLPHSTEYSKSLWHELEPIVDYAFVETQALWLDTGHFDLGVCDIISAITSILLSQVSADPRDRRRICAGVSLAPWMAEGHKMQGFWNLSTSFATQFPGAPGRVAVSEICASPLCRLSQSAAQCLALTQRALYSPQSVIPVYLFLDSPNLNTTLTWGPEPRPGPNGSCVVLYDIDLDSYDQQCASAYWPSLSHFEIALAALSVTSPFAGIAQC